MAVARPGQLQANAREILPSWSQTAPGPVTNVWLPLLPSLHQSLLTTNRTRTQRTQRRRQPPVATLQTPLPPQMRTRIPLARMAMAVARPGQLQANAREILPSWSQTAPGPVTNVWLPLLPSLHQSLLTTNRIRTQRTQRGRQPPRPPPSPP